MSQQSGILRLLGKLKSSRSGSRRRVWIGLALAVLVIVVVLGWFHSRGTSFPPLPEPNGYDILVHGAAGIARVTNNVSNLSLEELEALVATNRSALEEIRRGLELPCAVPVQMTEAWFGSQSRNLMN